MLVGALFIEFAGGIRAPDVGSALPSVFGAFVEPTGALRGESFGAVAVPCPFIGAAMPELDDGVRAPDVGSALPSVAGAVAEPTGALRGVLFWADGVVCALAVAAIAPNDAINKVARIF